MRLELRPFRPRFAATVASWIRDDHDLHWVAPRTPPPITTRKVLDWAGANNHLWLLHESDRSTDHAGRPDAATAPPPQQRPYEANTPTGYGEINHLAKRPYHLWLGHIIIDPARRRRGIGIGFVDLLLHHAFETHHAETVSLVVFSDNRPAARCYLHCGFLSAGEELHRFRSGGARHRMLRMDVTRARWNDVRSREPPRNPLATAGVDRALA